MPSRLVFKVAGTRVRGQLVSPQGNVMQVVSQAPGGDEEMQYNRASIIGHLSRQKFYNQGNLQKPRKNLETRSVGNSSPFSRKLNSETILQKPRKPLKTLETEYTTIDTLPQRLVESIDMRRHVGEMGDWRVRSRKLLGSRD